MSGTSIRLREWQTLGPRDDARLSGLALTSNAALQGLIDDLRSRGRLHVLELARGLELRASSWVGRITLGNVTVAIEPKLQGAPLLQLLRYAYELRDLQMLENVRHAISSESFQDLLIHQLIVEITDLLGRGLHRSYRRRNEELASPRGRIDFSRHAASGGAVRAALPCEHHPRTASIPLNQALLAGLRFAVGCTDDLGLRFQLRRLAKLLEESVDAGPLQPDLLQRAAVGLDRRTRSYRPALTLIELLLQSAGVSFNGSAAGPSLPGFLFDMNRFFQALLSRFLRENLDGYVLKDEHRLQGMLAYDRSHNPQGRQAPTPRPDFVILYEGQVVAILDAKYRDLWERSLPREMLYQLAMYALSQKNVHRAVILYPTMSPEASDQVVVLNEPVQGARRAEIVLRPVKLLELERLLRPSATREDIAARKQMAHLLVFGGGAQAI